MLGAMLSVVAEALAADLPAMRQVTKVLVRL